MSPDRMRASDREREEAVAVLRAAAAEGRLDLDELDERTATAYTARTRGELGAVLADIPEARLPTPAVRDRKLPRVPGRLGFVERWRAPAGRMDTVADLLEFVAPPLRTFGYELVERAPDRLVFRRRVTPAWTIPVAVFLFPFGLLAPLLAKDSETITIELVEQGRETLMVAQGTAPLRVRRAFALLEPSRSPTPGGTRR